MDELSLCLSRETLEATIEDLESLITEHEKEYEAHPQILGYEEHFYSHEQRAFDYKRLLGYLRELQQLRNAQ